MNDSELWGFTVSKTDVPSLQDIEAKYFEWVYQVAKYNQVRAARLAGVSRGCFRMKLKQYHGDKYL